MRKLALASLLFVTLAGPAAGRQAAPPSEEQIRTVYARVLAQADTDKDGKLSVAECRALFTDQTIATKSCRFWDINKDGFITADEYVERVQYVTNKKK